MSCPAFPTRVLSAAVILLATAVLVGGCSGVQRLSEYNATTKKNFIDGCSISRTVENGKVVETQLADRSDCECIYNKMKDTYKLSAEDLAAYEDEVAEAKVGAAPEPPEKLKQAISDCLGTSAGPTVPESGKS